MNKKIRIWITILSVLAMVCIVVVAALAVHWHKEDQSRTIEDLKESLRMYEAGMDRNTDKNESEAPATESEALSYETVMHITKESLTENTSAVDTDVSETDEDTSDETDTETETEPETEDDTEEQSLMESLSEYVSELENENSSLSSDVDALNEFGLQESVVIESLINVMESLRGDVNIWQINSDSQYQIISQLQRQINDANTHNAQLVEANEVLSAMLASAQAALAQPVTTPAPVTQPQPPQDNNFKYVAIGNSITQHIVNDYWWNSNGMAASTTESDYFHRVTAYLQLLHGAVTAIPVQYVIWETQYNDRGETYFVIDNYLDESVNLVTIQLGENANNIDTFRQDMEMLINHVHAKCPKAQVILIDDFWGMEGRSEMKIAAAANTGAYFADLSAIKDNTDYYAGLGTTVYDAAGTPHIIEHAGVAKHPGDAAMEYIANAVVALIW